MKITPLILAGGKGTRLWPMSRTSTPKQFLKLTNDLSLLQNTILRLEGCDFEQPIIVCNKEDKFIVNEQLELIDKEATLILESVGKNTAPAIAVAANHKICSENAILVLPSDHEIKDLKMFKKTIKQAIKFLDDDLMVTFGIKPLSANTGYGYIKKGIKVDDGFKIDEFKEKPSIDVAEKYFKSDNYFWNSGMFLFKSDSYLGELKKYSSEIFNVCTNSNLVETIGKNEFLINEKIYSSCPSDSIDYAVMEKTKRGIILDLNVGWSDIGSWKSLWEFLKKDKDGNVLIGDTIISEVSNSYIKSENRLVTAVGLDNIIVVDTKDSILIVSNDKSEDVKSVLNTLDQNERVEREFHREVARPWGKYDSIDIGDGFQVKRITVHPKQKLSVQMHHHRAEHWIVVQGIGRVHYGEHYKDLNVNDSTYHDKEVIHSLENPGDSPLILIEVQIGDYLGEDDIVRYEDIYGRS